MNDALQPLVRPGVVTLISVLFIISGILGFLGLGMIFALPDLMATLELNHIPVWFSLLLTVVSSLVYLVSGMVMLLGKNWGRHMVLAVFAPLTVLGFFVTPYPSAMVISVFILAIMVWPLYRPIVSRYFLGTQTAEDVVHLTKKPEQQIGMPRKVVAIVGFVVSGFFVYLITFLSFLDITKDSAVLIDLLSRFGLPWLVLTLLSLWLLKTPSRFFASGLTFLVGAGFTTFVLFIALFYPMPAEYSEVNLKDQVSNFAVGLPVLIFFIVSGTAQLILGIVNRRKATEVTSEV